MTRRQHIGYAVGGILSISPLDRPTTVTLSAYDDGGAAIISDEAATVCTCATTLNGDHDRGAVSVLTVDGGNVTAGRTYQIRDDLEEVLVRAVDGDTVYLRAPLAYDHADGAGFSGSLCTYAVSAAAANRLVYDGHCEWGIDGEIFCTSFSITPYRMQRLATIQDLRAYEPKISQLIDEETDIEDLLDRAHARVLSRLCMRDAEARDYVYCGSQEFRDVTALTALQIMWGGRRGDEAERLYDRYRTEAAAELDALAQTVPRDRDSDRAKTQAERPAGGSRIIIR